MIRSPALRRRLAVSAQMILGALILALAVSTRFDFEDPQRVELHIFEGLKTSVALPGLVVLAIKMAVAFCGSYLLMRKDLILPPDGEPKQTLE
jgi:hypothetical protein